MDTLAQLRNWTADKDHGRTDFDDLARGHFTAAKNTGMIRIVEGADDLAVSINRADRNAGRVTLPTITEAHNGDTCNNPRCCPQDGPVDPRSEGQIRFINSLIDQLAELNPRLAEDATAYTVGMTDNGKWTRNDGVVKGTISTWIDRLKAKIAELKVTTPVAAPTRSEGVWTVWRELAAKLVEVGGRHGARFAVDTENGAVNELAFWWIVRNDNGLAGPRYFLRQVIGGQGAVRVRMTPEAMIRIARKIEAAGPLDAMIRYGQEIGECGHCGRQLTNDESRAAGIGPVCRKGKGM